MMQLYSYKLPRIVIIGFLLASAFFVIAAYNRNLPLFELDEGVLLGQTIRSRGLENFTTMFVPGYPPFILAVFTVIQHVTEFVFQESMLDHTHLILHTGRILAVGANLITVYLIYQVGSKLKYPLTGLVSALAWSILPLVHEHTSRALTEPWQILFITASALAMVKTFETQKPRWAIVSTVCGLIAITAKYNNFMVLGFGSGVALYLLITQSSKKAWVLTLVTQAILIGATAYYLLEVYNAFALVVEGRPETTRFLNEGILSLVDPASIAYAFSTSATQMGFPNLPLLLLVLVPGIGLFMFRAETYKRIAVAYMLIFTVIFVWLVPTYLVFDHLKYRYVSSASPVVVILIAIAIWQFIELAFDKQKKWIPVTFLIACGIWIAQPAWARLVELRNLIKPNTAQAMVAWSTYALEPGETFLINGYEGGEKNWRLFNNMWGGYKGPFRPVDEILHYTNRSKEEWYEEGIEYIHLTGNYPGDSPNLPFSRDEMLLMKAIPPQGEEQQWYGDAWYIYRLDGYQYESDSQFGDAINLIGYDMPTTTVTAGDVITFRPFWQATQTPQANYQMFIHLSELDMHTVLAQVDTSPGLPAYITTLWQDPQEVIVGEEIQLTVPPDLSPGTYRILLGLYDLETGVRLPVSGGTDALELAQIAVEPSN